MIVLCDESNINEINNIQENTPFATRIKSLVDAYGFNCNFFNVWLQYSDNKEVISVVSRLEGAVILYNTDKSNFNEIKDFLDVIGYSSLLADNRYTACFDSITFKTGSIMKLKKSINSISEYIDKSVSLRQVYSIMEKCKSDTFSVPQFEPFYLDMSHRIRHNTARCYAITENSKYIACAMTTAETKKSAVVGGVAVLPEYRQKGYGKIIMKSLCFDLQSSSKEVYIYRNINENKEFYSYLGFEQWGEWAEYS